MQAYFSLLVALLLSTTALARWPIFAVPDEGYLVSHHYIETSGCPEGEGRLTPGVVIPIKPDLCHAVCPGWVWFGSNENVCHVLTKDTLPMRLSISRIGTSNMPLYSVVTATYGAPGQPAFTFTLTTEKDNHWYCYEINPKMHLVSCANDI